MQNQRDTAIGPRVIERPPHDTATVNLRAIQAQLDTYEAERGNMFLLNAPNHIRTLLDLVRAQATELRVRSEAHTAAERELLRITNTQIPRLEAEIRRLRAQLPDTRRTGQD
jgi:cob(I)alamin adenosyltransferase